ncbi:hypothetical protein K461DRAFT_317919 [Myriangium duriaei CBS 260.36]|uniref:Uncharacterized protein n=1 Tax=Myriangium duriaei CBS 260.36 TaxID=1168546 RepID=A0A9P4JAG8_9PEZI|nr:hypothetical protein K461DRAFT_317919 [Myriangium duriaei CBS 260.36]
MPHTRTNSGNTADKAAGNEAAIPEQATEQVARQVTYQASQQTHQQILYEAPCSVARPASQQLDDEVIYQMIQQATKQIANAVNKHAQQVTCQVAYEVGSQIAQSAKQLTQQAIHALKCEVAQQAVHQASQDATQHIEQHLTQQLQTPHEPIEALNDSIENLWEKQNVMLRTVQETLSHIGAAVVSIQGMREDIAALKDINSKQETNLFGKFASVEEKLGCISTELASLPTIRGDVAALNDLRLLDSIAQIAGKLDHLSTETVPGLVGTVANVEEKIGHISNEIVPLRGMQHDITALRDTKLLAMSIKDTLDRISTDSASLQGLREDVAALKDVKLFDTVMTMEKKLSHLSTEIVPLRNIRQDVTAVRDINSRRDAHMLSFGQSVSFLQGAVQGMRDDMAALKDGNSRTMSQLQQLDQGMRNNIASLRDSNSKRNTQLKSLGQSVSQLRDDLGTLQSLPVGLEALRSDISDLSEAVLIIKTDTFAGRAETRQALAQLEERWKKVRKDMSGYEESAKSQQDTTDRIRQGLQYIEKTIKDSIPKQEMTQGSNSFDEHTGVTHRLGRVEEVLRAVQGLIQDGVIYDNINVEVAPKRGRGTHRSPTPDPASRKRRASIAAQKEEGKRQSLLRA